MSVVAVPAVAVPDKPKLRTPIERYIEDGPLVDRRRKYEEEQAKAGFCRLTVRVHQDDIEQLKRYVGRLLKKRLSGD